GALSGWLLPSRLDLWPHLVREPEALGGQLQRSLGGLPPGGRRQWLRTDRRRGPSTDRRSLCLHRGTWHARGRLSHPLPGRTEARCEGKHDLANSATLSRVATGTGEISTAANAVGRCPRTGAGVDGPPTPSSPFRCSDDNEGRSGELEPS